MSTYLTVYCRLRLFLFLIIIIIIIIIISPVSDYEAFPRENWKPQNPKLLPFSLSHSILLFLSFFPSLSVRLDEINESNDSFWFSIPKPHDLTLTLTLALLPLNRKP